MLQFVNPIAFIALASLAVPVAIHLWSRGLGRRVRVGSLRFLEETERRQLRTIRLNQVPLLLIRLLVFSLLVCLVAQPVWIDEKPVAGEQAARWVLVHPETLQPASYAETYRTVDSLAATGASVRRLAPGFPAVDLDAVDLDEGPAADEGAVDVWSLLREADRALPEGSTITVVGPGRVVDFRGARPALRSFVAWIEVDAGSPNRWVAEARWIGADSIDG
jgi:hypothetical protein